MVHDDSPFIRRLRNAKPLPPPHQLIAPEAWSQSLQDLEIFWSKLWWFAKKIPHVLHREKKISFPKGGSSIHDSLITERYAIKNQAQNCLQLRHWRPRNALNTFFGASCLEYLRSYGMRESWEGVPHCSPSAPKSDLFVHPMKNCISYLDE